MSKHPAPVIPNRSCLPGIKPTECVVRIKEEREGYLGPGVYFRSDSKEKAMVCRHWHCEFKLFQQGEPIAWILRFMLADG